MKSLKFFATALFAVATTFIGCSDDGKEIPIVVENTETLSQTISADQAQGNQVKFATTGAWQSNIVSATRAVDWVSISPASSTKGGDHTVSINLEPNTTGKDREAAINITCEDKTITISVKQESTKKNGNPLVKLIKFRVLSCNENWTPANATPYIAASNAEIKIFKDGKTVGAYTTNENGIAEAQLADGDYTYAVSRGDESNVHTGFILDGMFTSQTESKGKIGKLRYYDYNADGVINDEDKVEGASLYVDDETEVDMDIYIAAPDFTLSSQELSINFLYSINPNYANLLPDVLKNIDLYLYKESGELYFKAQLTKEELKSTNYNYTTLLEKGAYKLVAWMNLGDEYTIKGTEKFETAEIELVSGDKFDTATNTAPLYYGYDDMTYDREESDITVTVDGKPISKTINFAKNTNNVRIELRANKVLTGTVSTAITGKNAKYNFNNKTIATNTHTYYPYELNESDQAGTYTYTASLTTQKLVEDDDTYITLSIGQKEVVHQHLTGLIMKNPLFTNNFQLVRNDSYHIIFQLAFNNNNWEVEKITVNDWDLIMF